MSMESDLKKIRSFYDETKGALKTTKRDLIEAKQKLAQAERELEKSQKAGEIIHYVAKATQEELEFHLSDIVSLAIQGVFTSGPNLAVSFVSRRSQIEVDIGFEENGLISDPMDDDGGGLVDIASMSLRFSCWALRKKRTRPVFLMDEPLRHLKGLDYPRKGARIIKEISERLGLQIIMVSHDPELIEEADKVIRVGRKNNRSIIK